MDEPKELLQVFAILFNGSSIETGSNPVCPRIKAFCVTGSLFHLVKSFDFQNS